MRKEYWEDVTEGDFSDIHSPCCRDGTVKWDGTNYRCSQCRRVIPRGEVFSIFGGAAGPQCYECDQMFPWCEDCMYGYETYSVDDNWFEY